MAKTTIKEAVSNLQKQHKVKVTGLPTPRKTLPKSKLGKLADELKEVQQVRLALNKLTEAVKAYEQSIVDHIIDNTDLSVSAGAVGTEYKAIVMREDLPMVEDWDKLYAHIAKKKSFHLLNKALSRSAVKEIWDDGKEVPGVGSMQIKKISLTKV